MSDEQLIERQRERLRETALVYACLGWPVLPLFSVTGSGCTCGDFACTSPGKHPATVHGLKDATRDPSAISKWWSRERWNIGVRTGSESGFLALDVDVGAGGAQSLSRLEERNGALPRTCRSLTGGGGFHLLFKYPACTVSNSAGRLGPGLDVRGEGGYIVAPPSVHLSGRPYNWAPGAHPDSVAPTEVPRWLLALLAERSGSPMDYRSADASFIPEGRRNVTLTSLAGSMRRHGCSPDAILAALLVENRAKCRPPLPESELRGIALSVGRYDPAVHGATGYAVPRMTPHRIVTVEEVLAKGEGHG